MSKFTEFLKDQGVSEETLQQLKPVADTAVSTLTHGLIQPTEHGSALQLPNHEDLADRVKGNPAYKRLRAKVGPVGAAAMDENLGDLFEAMEQSLTAWLEERGVDAEEGDEKN